MIGKIILACILACILLVIWKVVHTCKTGYSGGIIGKMVAKVYDVV
jgi:hypothetical protein